MTDKATVEVPTPIAGTVKELKFKAGDVVKVDSVMLTLEGGRGAATAAAPSAAKATAAPVSIPTATAVNFVAASAAINPPVADSKVLATPATRRLAREMNVDINTLDGTGLAGRVTRDDVLTSKGGTSMGRCHSRWCRRSRSSSRL